MVPAACDIFNCVLTMFGSKYVHKVKKHIKIPKKEFIRMQRKTNGCRCILISIII